MIRVWAAVLLAGTLVPATACVGGATPPADPLESVAESYVKLVLAIGRHDPLFVDAYYGPPAWKTQSDAGSPVPIPELLSRTRALAAALAKAGGPADRKRFLSKQLVALETHLRRLSGETFSLGDECRLLFDATPPRRGPAEFDAAQRELERLVPGKGPLLDRIEALRTAVYIPRERVAATLAAALEAARKANAAFVTLPAGESFDAVLVTGQPWGAYNWYLGNFKSRIELNTDLPTQLNGLLSTMCHEGYPGHHTYNALLEGGLVRGKGWQEFTVYPLYSPQSMLAEGSANTGEDIVFTPEERRRVLTEVLAPAGGVPPQAVLALDRIRDALKPLRYVAGEGARMLLDEHRPDSEVIAFLMRYGLVNRDRAEKSIAFARTYRSYVFNYTLGEDIVRSAVGEGPDRRKRFYDLLRRPVVPSELVGTGAGPR